MVENKSTKNLQCKIKRQTVGKKMHLEPSRTKIQARHLRLQPFDKERMDCRTNHGKPPATATSHKSFKSPEWLEALPILKSVSLCFPANVFRHAPSLPVQTILTSIQISIDIYSSFADLKDSQSTWLIWLDVSSQTHHESWHESSTVQHRCTEPQTVLGSCLGLQELDAGLIGTHWRMLWANIERF